MKCLTEAQIWRASYGGLKVTAQCRKSLHLVHPVATHTVYSELAPRPRMPISTPNSFNTRGTNLD